MNSLDFLSTRRRIRPWAVAMLGVAAIALGSVAENVTRIAQLEEEVAQIDADVELRQRAVERERRRQKNMTPEQKRIEHMLAHQRAKQDGSGLEVVDWIERAWVPEIALTQLTVDKAGRSARIEGGAADLSQVFQFVERLHERHEKRRVGLLQHRIQTIAGRNVYLFSVSVEAS
ncbi:hypothetical protein [Burkholderia sp. BCC0044]|uniref:hypothetical protein n=1 Tax=Burkholderia sp. BCC0044 TaxID=2676295 RepID=UPI0015888E26|nr:hypothetical protein [Burkholderia sp. BCC0044]